LESPGELDAALGEPGGPGKGALGVRGEVLGKFSERGAEPSRLADERRARLVRNVQPLVRIGGDRVRSLDAGKERRQAGRDFRHRAVSAVDMEPERLAPAEFGQLV